MSPEGIVFLSKSAIEHPERRGGNRLPEDLLPDITTDHLITGKDALILEEEGLRQALLRIFPNWDYGNRQEDRSRILVGGRNFGIGSSRENAAEAVRLNGFGAVFAESFGPIFFENLINQGVVPSTDFFLLQKIMEGKEPQLEEFTRGLSFVQRRILHYGGLPRYIRAIYESEEAFPQDEIPERAPFPQTAVEKVCSVIGGTVAGKVKRASGEDRYRAGDSMVIQTQELVGYDVFIAHMERVLNRYFNGKISFPTNHFWLFADHFSGSDDPNAIRAIETVKRYWEKYSEAFRGDDGIYNKVLPLRLPVGSVIVGMDSHSPELGIIPGALVIPIGYTAAACAIANEGLIPYTLPQTIKLEFIGDLPEICDTKDTIWQLVHRYFRGSMGNGMMFEIGGEGFARLPYSEAAKHFNAVTEYGGIGSIGTTPNPQVIDYLRAYGKNLEDISDQEIGRIFEHLQPDPGAEYAAKIRVNLAETEPAVVGPHSHKEVTPLAELRDQMTFDRLIFNSCAGSTLQDIAILASVLQGERTRIPIDIHLADPLTRKHAQGIGILSSLTRSGARIARERSCGPCLGLGARVNKGERVLSTNNRNYPGRMGDREAEVYLSSAPVAALTAKLGRIPTLEDLYDNKQYIVQGKHLATLIA